MNDNLLEDLLNTDLPDVTTEGQEEEDAILSPLLSEINDIADSDIRLFVRAILLRGTNFWTAPSNLENDHPPDEHHPGGNVLHTKRVVRVVKLICLAQERMKVEQDLLIAAALLHDLLKGGIGEKYVYDSMHPYTLDLLVFMAREEDEKESYNSGKSNAAFLEEEYVQQILRLARCHLGRWSPIPETMPITTLEWNMHLADLIAAELHTLTDEVVRDERWNI